MSVWVWVACVCVRLCMHVCARMCVCERDCVCVCYCTCMEVRGQLYAISFFLPPSCRLQELTQVTRSGDECLYLMSFLEHPQHTFHPLHLLSEHIVCLQWYWCVFRNAWTATFKSYTGQLLFCLHDLQQVTIWVLPPIKQVCLYGVKGFNNILSSMWLKWCQVRQRAW